MNRIAGQIAGIQRMIAKGRGCAEIATQIAAVRAALTRLATELIAQHLAEVCADPERASDSAKRKQALDEAVSALQRL